MYISSRWYFWTIFLRFFSMNKNLLHFPIIWIKNSWYCHIKKCRYSKNLSGRDFWDTLYIFKFLCNSVTFILLKQYLSSLKLKQDRNIYHDSLSHSQVMKTKSIFYWRIRCCHVLSNSLNFFLYNFEGKTNIIKTSIDGVKEMK